MQRLIGALLITMLVLAGCGSSSSSNASSHSTTTTKPDDQRTRAQLDADRSAAAHALLTLADFPDGWTAKPQTDDTPDAPDLKADFAKCLHVDVSLLAEERIKAKSDKFS